MWISLSILVIMAIVAIINVVIANQQHQNPLLKNIIAIILIVLILAALILQIVNVVSEKKIKDAQKYSGILKGSALTLLSPKQDLYPKLKLGDSETYIVYKGSEGQPIFSFFEDSDLTIWIDEGKLKLSTIIRDVSGNIVAEIIGNEWRVRQGDMWDRNYNDSALEVRNPDGEIILQVKLENDYIQFAAKMYDKCGNGVAIGGGEDSNIGKVGIIEMTGTNHPVLELVIEPMFRYPSDLHIGELLNN